MRSPTRLKTCTCTALVSSVYAPLSQIMRNNQIANHSYTDDTQIYLALSPNDYSPIDSQVKNLGVILETDICFSSYVTKSAYYHLKNIVLFPVEILRNVFMALSPAGWIIVMDSSQRRALDSCSSTRTSEYLTPVLRSLHWLPVTFRIDFKVLLLVYNSLNGLGPKYIADMLTEYKPNRPLRSLGSSQLEIPRVHTKQGVRF